jgi:hypothetical protein
VSIPGPWAALILLAAAYRIWRLISEDDILDVPRRKIVRLPLDWEEGEAIDDRYRVTLAKFISCPWCLGFHVTWVLWLFWEWQPHLILVLSTPFALSAGVGAISTLIDRD